MYFSYSLTLSSSCPHISGSTKTSHHDHWDAWNVAVLTKIALDMLFVLVFHFWIAGAAS